MAVRFVDANDAGRSNGSSRGSTTIDGWSFAERHADNFLAMLHLGSALIRLRHLSLPGLQQ